jgi:hypothetical protein
MAAKQILNTQREGSGGLPLLIASAPMSLQQASCITVAFSNTLHLLLLSAAQTSFMHSLFASVNKLHPFALRKRKQAAPKPPNCFILSASCDTLTAAKERM